VDAFFTMKRFTFAIGQRVVIGSDLDDSLLQSFVEWTAGLATVFHFELCGLTTFGRAMKARRRILDVIAKKVETMKRDGATYRERDSMLFKLVNASFEGSTLDSATLGDFVLVMLFASHDTTAGTMQSTLRFIALYPEQWSRVVAEVDKLWDGKALLSSDIIEKAVLARGFIEEVLRLAAPVPSLIRRASTPVEIDGYVIPAGWSMKVSIAGMGRSSFGEEFTPDNIHRHGELKGNENFPFGGGRRMCVGYKLARQELYIWLMCLARNYAVSCAPQKHNKFPINFYRTEVRLTHREENYKSPVSSIRAGA